MYVYIYILVCIYIYVYIYIYGYITLPCSLLLGKEITTLDYRKCFLHTVVVGYTKPGHVII